MTEIDTDVLRRVFRIHSARTVIWNLCDALDAARAEIARLTEQAGNRCQRNVELVNANTARTETAEAQIAAVRALISDGACHIYGGTPDASDDGVPLGMLIVALDARS